MKFPALVVLAATPLLLANLRTDPGHDAARIGDPPFRPSRSCAQCHSNAAGATAMRDEQGRGIAPLDLWRSSMMANSARDPLWQAAVSAEIAATPSRAADIQAKCNRCHTPMANGAESGSERRATLAQDGVSCTVCHSIEDVGLGSESSFSGHFVTTTEDRLYGPHAAPFAHPMQMHTGLTPQLGEHITRSALCATCHTLFTHTLDADGEATGSRYAEQTPYLEWRNSVFDDERDNPSPRAASCQDCHVPTTSADGQTIETRIARNPRGRDFPPTRPRSPFGRHVFVGGNTLVPAILRDHRELLGVAAPAEAFDATIAAARAQLQTRTAQLDVSATRVSDAKIEIEARIVNLAGHKFPSAYPSRRSWLRVRVFDANHESVFVSGDFDEAGRILGSDGRPLASESAGGPVEPHHDVIESPDEVQIYQVVMSDEAGHPTHRLMRAARSHKDNRLLPEGWLATHPDAAVTAPVGTSDDANFAAGTDTVTFRVPAPSEAGGPYRVEVELCYQTLGARYADELFAWRTPEVKRFEALYAAARRTPEIVARGGALLD